MELEEGANLGRFVVVSWRLRILTAFP